MVTAFADMTAQQLETEFEDLLRVWNLRDPYINANFKRNWVNTLILVSNTSS